MSILYLEPGSAPAFPDVEHAEEDLVAVGADLAPERILHAYELGIFPWFGADEIPLWWSPDPRAVLPADQLHISRSMRRVVRNTEFRLTWNACFERVMRECSRDRPDGVWIHEAMVQSYCKLHARGAAHSLEVWVGDELAGGIYGVQRGRVFAAESKFFRVRDMSKLALFALVQSLDRAGVELIDVQFQSEHLAKLGVVEWPRARYLERLRALRGQALDLRELEPVFVLPGGAASA